ncbi:hypothetical protein MIR68_001699 [Amoeboaphelidium protococcarum]|nr:hypothetical protein MIR68_001699 [Amoeboaphelidium protococcarum]
MAEKAIKTDSLDRKRAFSGLRAGTLPRLQSAQGQPQSSPMKQDGKNGSGSKGALNMEDGSNINQVQKNGSSKDLAESAAQGGDGVRSWYNRYRKTPSVQPAAPGGDKITGQQKPQSMLFDVKKWPLVEYNQVIEEVHDEPQSPNKGTIVDKLWQRKKKAQNASKKTLTLDHEKLNLSKTDRRRQEIIYELIVTERDYVQDMKVLADLFIKKIRDKKLLSQYNIRKIFSNVEELAGVNETFYNSMFDKRATAFEQAHQVMQDKNMTEAMRLEKASEVIVGYTVGDIFTLLTPYFRSYSLYCSGHTEASETLNAILKMAKASKEAHKTLRKKNMTINPRIAKQLKGSALVEDDMEYDAEKQRERAKELALFLQYCSFRPECKNLDIFSFLIKPIQRLCKYPLLLKEILKVTSESHPDYKLLNEAMALVEKVVGEVNERKRFHEGQQTRIVDLRKKFVFDGANLVGIEEGRDKRFDLMGVVSRRLIRELGESGELLEVKDIIPGKPVSQSQTTQRWLLLFTDILIINKVSEKSVFAGDVSKVKVKYVVSLSNLMSAERLEQDGVDTVIQIGSEKTPYWVFKVKIHELLIPNEGYSTVRQNALVQKQRPKDGYICFACPTEYERDSWVLELNKVLSEIKKDKEQREKLINDRPTTVVDKEINDRQEKVKSIVEKSAQKDKIRFDSPNEMVVDLRGTEEFKVKKANFAQSLNPNLFLSNKVEEEDGSGNGLRRNLSSEILGMSNATPKTKFLENMEALGSRQSMDIFDDDDEDNDDKNAKSDDDVNTKADQGKLGAGIVSQNVQPQSIQSQVEQGEAQSSAELKNQQNPPVTGKVRPSLSSRSQEKIKTSIMTMFDIERESNAGDVQIKTQGKKIDMSFIEEPSNSVGQNDIALDKEAVPVMVASEQLKVDPSSAGADQQQSQTAPIVQASEAQQQPDQKDDDNSKKQKRVTMLLEKFESISVQSIDNLARSQSKLNGSSQQLASGNLRGSRILNPPALPAKSDNKGKKMFDKIKNSEDLLKSQQISNSVDNLP